jgi:hypothetical protein
LDNAKIIRTCLALIAVVTIMLAMAAPAVANDYDKAGGKYMGDKGYDGKIDRMKKAHPDVYMTIAVTGMTGDTASFSVANMAMIGKEDTGVLITPSTPLTGTYNTSNDMGYISTAGLMPVTMTIDTMDKTTVPVAGASAIMGMHDMKVLARQKDYKLFQFGKVSFLTSSGNMTTYKLDKPVRVTYSEDRNMVVMDAYPTFTKRMSEALATTPFSSTAPPIPLSSLKEKKSAAMPERVDYQKPEYVAPPT